MSEMLERLHRLAATWGPAGREHKMAETLEDLIQPYVDEIEIDKFGNLIAIKHGIPGKGRVMLAAHMDTVGAIALNVSSTGLIHIAPVGDLKAHHAIGQRVVWGSGAVGILQHEPVSEAKDVDLKKLWCDIGATSKEEALENVRLGDICVFAGELQQLGDALAGPGLDNRAGCAVLLEVAEHLTDPNVDVAFVFAAQGEIGPRGAGPAAYRLNPDLALVLDVTSAGDVPKGPRVEVKLGGGPALKLKDGGYLAHGPLADLVARVAAEHKVPLQTEIAVGAGDRTDAQVVSIAGQGVPTAVIDIPARYRGTANEMVNLRDLHAAADLVLKLLSSSLELG
ncbi:MAG TPA: hypothetical protein VGK74_18925 [Symbiobacteriaceae bacterium]|jgi:endoglucanase